MDVLDFKRRSRRVSPPEPPTVPCPKCGADVDMYAVRCRACRVSFSGPAYQFGPPLYRRGALRKRLGRAFVAALLVAFFVFLVQLALGRL